MVLSHDNIIVVSNGQQQQACHVSWPAFNEIRLSDYRLIMLTPPDSGGEGVIFSCCPAVSFVRSSVHTDWHYYHDIVTTISHDFMNAFNNFDKTDMEYSLAPPPQIRLGRSISFSIWRKNRPCRPCNAGSAMVGGPCANPQFYDIGLVYLCAKFVNFGSIKFRLSWSSIAGRAPYDHVYSLCRGPNL